MSKRLEETEGRGVGKELSFPHDLDYAIAGGTGPRSIKLAYGWSLQLPR